MEAVDMEIKLNERAGQVALPPYWLEGGNSEPSDDYCRHCADKAAKAYKAEICGGWSSEADSCRHCATCGSVLEYSLTTHGVIAELEHFRSVRFRKPLSKEEAFHVARLIEAAPDDAEARAIAKRAVLEIQQSTRESVHE